jgi:hypothetical protein
LAEPFLSWAASSTPSRYRLRWLERRQYSSSSGRSCRGASSIDSRARPVRTAAFFAACGVFFWRFLRLAVIVGAAYWAVFARLHPYLFGTLWNQ